MFRCVVGLQHMGVARAQQERGSCARHHRPDLSIPFRTTGNRHGQHRLLFRIRTLC